MIVVALVRIRPGCVVCPRAHDSLVHILILYELLGRCPSDEACLWLLIGALMAIHRTFTRAVLYIPAICCSCFYRICPGCVVWARPRECSVHILMMPAHACARAGCCTKAVSAPCTVSCSGLCVSAETAWPAISCIYFYNALYFVAFGSRMPHF